MHYLVVHFIQGHELCENVKNGEFNSNTQRSFYASLAVSLYIWHEKKVVTKLNWGRKKFALHHQ